MLYDILRSTRKARNLRNGKKLTVNLVPKVSNAFRNLRYVPYGVKSIARMAACLPKILRMVSLRLETNIRSVLSSEGDIPVVELLSEMKKICHEYVD